MFFTELETRLLINTYSEIYDFLKNMSLYLFKDAPVT